MPRPFTSRVVTANDLRLGGVVYLTADDRWSPRLSDAELLEDEAHAQLRLLYAESQPERVVGAYLAEARAGAAGPEPTHLRERLRAAGPSAYAFPRPPAARARRA